MDAKAALPFGDIGVGDESRHVRLRRADGGIPGAAARDGAAADSILAAQDKGIAMAIALLRKSFFLAVFEKPIAIEHEVGRAERIRTQGEGAGLADIDTTQSVYSGGLVGK